MKKGFTPVVALTLFLFVLIVVLGVVNFWFVEIEKEEVERETFEITMNCEDKIEIDNYGFPNNLGPLTIESGDQQFEDDRPVRHIIINCE